MAYLLILWSLFGFGHPQQRPATASGASRHVGALEDDGIFKPPCPKCTKW